MNNPEINKLVVVYGAYGHTGKFVVAELVKRGYMPVLSGRSADKLQSLSATYPDLEIKPASVDDPGALDSALQGAHLIINCAGPFLDTATPIIEAALRAGIHYLDVAAEQQSVLSAHKNFGAAAVNKEVVIIPAMAFFGGLADLLATATMGDWDACDSIDVAVALDRWLPTAGTRTTGERNPGRRLTLSNKQLVFVPEIIAPRKWEFPEPFGWQDVQDFPLTEVITISQHLHVDRINTFLNLAPLDDIHNAETPQPKAADESGRSAQVFLMEVIVASGGKLRRGTATGRDIYAITAPLVVEATDRILDGRTRKRGVVSAGEVFDAGSFLHSMCPEHLVIHLNDTLDPAYSN